MVAVIAALDWPARRFSKLFAWLRRAPNRRRPVLRSITPEPKPRLVVDDTDDAAPCEPAGAILRPAAKQPKPATVVLSPIRKGLSEVPPLPHVVRELLRELSDPASSARSVAAIASSDPALAASLLRTVNSAAMGLNRKVASVSEAVSLLGYSLVRSLVIRMRLQLIMPTRGGQQAYDAEDVWVHSLAVAYAAEALAERVPGLDKGFVSTLGLLHDIGKLAINSYFPTSAAQIRTRCADHPDESFLDRERRILGADHAEIGAMLATHWKLPADLLEAIRWHHEPAAAPDTLSETVRQATSIVHVANQLAKYCYVYSEDMEIDIVSDDLLLTVGLPRPITRLLGSRVRQAISRAIFFADDSSTQTIGAIRRFLRIRSRPPVPSLPTPEEPARHAHEPHVAWADDSWVDQLFSESPIVDCSPASNEQIDRPRTSRVTQTCLKSRCTAGGIQKLLAAATAHLDQFSVDEKLKLPARFVLRRLLPNLSEIAAAEPIEVVVACRDRTLITAIRCPALAFEKRFGAFVAPRTAKHVLNSELANVLNLRWFGRATTTSDGSAIVFVSHAG